MMHAATDGDPKQGLAMVEAAVLGLEKLDDDETPENFSKRERIFCRYASDIAHHCDSMRNPAGYRICQVAASRSIERLLSLISMAGLVEVRNVAAIALGQIAFDSKNNAATIAASKRFVPVISAAFEPIHDFRQQEEYRILLHLLQAIVASVPEAPGLTMLMRQVASLLQEDADGVPPCPAVRLACVEVLLSCAMYEPMRLKVASVLSPEGITKMLARGPCEDQYHFPRGLLMAAISDLALPEPTVVDPVLRYWSETSFFDDLSECLASALRSEQWPLQSGIYHKPWKLACVCKCLSWAGFGTELESTLPLLIQIVSDITSPDDGAGIPGCWEFVAAVHAASALRAMSGIPSAAAVEGIFAAAPNFRQGLQMLAPKDAHARELLEILDLGEGAFAIAQKVSDDYKKTCSSESLTVVDDMVTVMTTSPFY